MVDIERRDFFNSSVVCRDDDLGSKKISGIASVFFNREDPGTQYEIFPGLLERVMPGAFDKAFERGDDVRALFNHDSNNLLGRTGSGTLSLEVRDEGLGYSIDLGETTVARDVASHISRGDVTGSSYAYTVQDDEWIEEGPNLIRQIRSVTLYDVGPVTFPAYESTSTVARSLDPMVSVRMAEMNSVRESRKIFGARVNRARLIKILERGI
jgi:HK97 family phage prohead protease